MWLPTAWESISCACPPPRGRARATARLQQHGQAKMAHFATELCREGVPCAGMHRRARLQARPRARPRARPPERTAVAGLEHGQLQRHVHHGGHPDLGPRNLRPVDLHLRHGNLAQGGTGRGRVAQAGAGAGCECLQAKSSSGLKVRPTGRGRARVQAVRGRRARAGRWPAH